eukprot:TRINITY_DN1154_c0_g1_i10.p1 TRINITY_DN1154_c0_g1~~TRINITY_DN1154_c0_g1_i10.p1  ORF type:complete len:243 (+),score=66.20 TRINITY_DN1154_c0_g1_i10:226-954(+)
MSDFLLDRGADPFIRDAEELLAFEMSQNEASSLVLERVRGRRDETTKLLEDEDMTREEKANVRVHIASLNNRIEELVRKIEEKDEEISERDKQLGTLTKALTLERERYTDMMHRHLVDNCSVSDPSLSVQNVGELITICLTFHVKCIAYVREVSVDDFKVTVSSELIDEESSKNITKTNITSVPNGDFIISFTPMFADLYTMTIFLGAHKIPGTPVQFNVSLYSKTLEEILLILAKDVEQSN